MSFPAYDEHQDSDVREHWGVWAVKRFVASVPGAIERLLECQTALFSAAVTGKIDVRGLMPQESTNGGGESTTSGATSPVITQQENSIDLVLFLNGIPDAGSEKTGVGFKMNVDARCMNIAAKSMTKNREKKVSS